MIELDENVTRRSFARDPLGGAHAACVLIPRDETRSSGFPGLHSGAPPLSRTTHSQSVYVCRQRLS